MSIPLALAGCAGAPPVDAPAVVLISLDTLRADRTGAYGYARPTTPALDAFAAQGVVFENAYTPATHTLPAHVSLHTGLFPDTHNVLASSDALASEVETLAQTLARSGYRTGAFVNAFYLGPKFGLARGFDDYDHPGLEQRADGSPPSRSAGETNAAVLEWLDAEPGVPFFLFVHYFDPHSDWLGLPYQAPAPFQERFAGPGPPGYRPGDGEVDASAWLRRINERGLGLDASSLRYVSSLYDAGVAYTDDRLGDLLERLDERGWLERALVVIVSDHGEEFQEHGRVLHEQVYEEVARVPLLFRFPADPALLAGLEARAGGDLSGLRGRRVEDVVQLTDVMPTLLAALGIEDPPAMQGQNLLPLLTGEGAQASRFAYLRDRPGSQYAVSDGRWKLVLQGARPALLFDLARDPSERDDVAARHPAERARLLEALRRWQTRSVLEARSPQAVEAPHPGERDALRALGYVE